MTRFSAPGSKMAPKTITKVKDVQNISFDLSLYFTARESTYSHVTQCQVYTSLKIISGAISMSLHYSKFLSN